MYFNLLNCRAEMHSTTVNITPEIAEEFLTRNTFNRDSNKPVARRRTAEYATAMRLGQWTPGTMIAFDEDGVLVDGQKRLQAVINSGQTITFTVLFNAPEGLRATIDLSLPRSLDEQLSLTHTPVTPKIAALARVFAFAPILSTSSNITERVRAVIHQHGDLLEWANTLHITNKVICGCVARAALHYSKDTLERFAHSYTTGVCTSESENAAVVLYRFYDRRRGRFSTGSSGYRRATYTYAQTAIKAYCEGRKLLTLHATSRDLFPLPSNIIAVPDESLELVGA